MIALLQRVTEASVTVEGSVIGEIGPGTLALIGVEAGDTSAQADRMLERIIAWRMFSDGSGRMNLNLTQAGGSLLLVPQFTLAANTDAGHRPSFSKAAAPALGEQLFDYLLVKAKQTLDGVASGRFGAHMSVRLINDGPVTFRLRVPPPPSSA